jgi:hypothetical protein
MIYIVYLQVHMWVTLLCRGSHDYMNGQSIIGYYYISSLSAPHFKLKLAQFSHITLLSTKSTLCSSYPYLIAMSNVIKEWL